MKTWEDWSDFEVCFKVVELLGLRTCEGQHYKPIVSYWAENGFMSKFDINNWSDMGPLIFDNKISLDFDFGAWPTAENGEDFIYTDKNPLRAAAIVFLMMKGVSITRINLEGLE